MDRLTDELWEHVKVTMLSGQCEVKEVNSEIDV